MKPRDRQMLRDYCQRRIFIRPTFWDRVCIWLRGLFA